MTKPDWSLQKVSHGSYDSFDGQFSIFAVMKKTKYDYWILLDKNSGREERFPTKKSCKEALRARYPYWK
tara:strand:- start:150 stop:356 length:207 start_codon:yes stop_codon:yes gene_type:complete